MTAGRTAPSADHPNSDWRHIQAFGLRIHTDFPLISGLESGCRGPNSISSSSDGTEDIVIRHLDRDDIGTPPMMSAEEARFVGFGRLPLRISAGREISYAKRDEPGLLRAFILGRCMGIALIQRGYLTLHASGAVIDGRAVAFIGRSGWGKTTTAAAFIARHHLCTDDMLPVSWSSADSSAEPVTHCGFPLAKLSPQAAEALQISPDGTEQAEDDTVHFYPVTRPEPTGPLPISAIFVLDESSDPQPSTTRLTSSAAWLELTRHSYAPYLLEAESALQKHHFESCARLAENVPVYSLSLAKHFDRLADVVQEVERRLRTI